MPKKASSKRKKEDLSDDDQENVNNSSSELTVNPLEVEKKRKVSDDCETTEQQLVDWSLIDIDATIMKFHELDNQIIQMEEERQNCLRILKSHPQTQIQYSTVNRSEKTKENLQATSFHNLGADCLKVIFDFAYARQVMEVTLVKQLFEMTTKIREGLLNANFILGISNPNYKFQTQSMPKFTGLHGLEITLTDKCIDVATTLMKNGCQFIHLTIRDDIVYNPKPNITKLLRNNVKSIQQIGAHGNSSAKIKFSYSEFTSLEHFSTLVHNRMPNLPNSKSLIVSYPEAHPFYLSADHEHSNLELLVTLFPSCKASPSNFEEDPFLKLLEKTPCKYYFSVRFISKAKKPNLMAQSQFIIKVYLRDDLMRFLATSLFSEVVSYSCSFMGCYSEVFEKLEGIQSHIHNIPGFLDSAFKQK